MITTRLSQREIDEARERRVMNTVAQRASFYRANPHRLAKTISAAHYLDDEL